MTREEAKKLLPIIKAFSEGKEIGTYTISKEGKLQIEINEEDVKNIIKEENQDLVVPAENLEITTDESISVEVEKPLEKTFNGSFEVSGAKEKQNEEPPFNLFGGISLFGGPVADIPDTVIHTVIAKNQANVSLFVLNCFENMNYMTGNPVSTSIYLIA